jgi:choice-of-anchor C domain-containing protein
MRRTALVIFAWIFTLVTVSAQMRYFSSSFEYPDITSTGVDYTDADVFYQTFYPGQRVDGWKVTQGSVDIVRHKQPTAAEGHQSLDLSGFEAGTIERVFPTKPGATYRLTFKFSGNPIGGFLSKMDVRWNGRTVNAFSYDTAPQTNSYQVNMHWQTKSVLLKAKKRLSKLEFRSLTQTQSGPALDQVEIKRIR